MKLIVEVEVLGTTSVAWRMSSAEIEGKDAEELLDIINNRFEKVVVMSLPERNGSMAFLNRAMLDRSIIRVKIIED